MARRSSSPTHSADLEWVGGVIDLPLSIAEVHRPSLALWLELPVGRVLASSAGAYSSATEHACETLSKALAQMGAARPKRPRRVRVATRELALAVAPVLGPDVRVSVGPTPELDALAEDFLSHLANQDRTAYLDDGSLPAELLRAFHEAAAALVRKRPWTSLGEDDVLRIDAPRLGVIGAALMMIGQAGVARALLLFPSARELALYRAAAVLLQTESDPPDDFGSPVLSVSFEPVEELAPEALASIRQAGLEVASKDAVPVLEHRDVRGDPLPVTAHDVRTALACLLALDHAFTAGHLGGKRSDFEASLHVLDGIEVRVAYPHAEHERIDQGLLAIAEASRPVRVGRNDPCPCGSGQKFKRCCAKGTPAGAPLVAIGAGERLRGHDLDRHLVAQLECFAARELGGRHRAADAVFAEPEACIQLLAPLSLFAFPVDGQPVAAHFLTREAARLSAVEREWLSLQLEARLTIWEVLEVERGASMRVRDLDGGREHVVLEKSGTRNLRHREMLLARIIEHEGVAWMVGCHPRTLSPSAAAAVLQAVHAAVPKRQRARIALEPLLVKAWDQAVEAHDRAARNPDVRNTEGHPLLFTTDHFELAAGKRGDVEGRIKKLPWCHEPEALPDGARMFPFIRPRKHASEPLESTLYGRIVTYGDRVTVQANSIERADVLRARLEGISGALVRHRLREHQDPRALQAASSPEHVEPEPVPAEFAAAFRELEERQLRAWLDTRVPALGGKTPRQAARGKSGREKVDLLLRDMELLRADRRDDLTPIWASMRAELGIT